MDDMGYGDVHALNPNGAGFETPHLDFLLEQVLFLQTPTRPHLFVRQLDMHSSLATMSTVDAILVVRGIIFREVKFYRINKQ